jgi:hypothetical protein
MYPKTTLEAPKSIVGAIRHYTVQELDLLDQRLNTPIQRYRTLQKSLEKHHHNFDNGEIVSDVSLFANAVSDMWLISWSAFGLLEADNIAKRELVDDPLETMMRSADDLSFPAFLPSKSWEDIKSTWVVRDKNLDARIPEKKFQLRKDDSGDQFIGFSSGALIDLDSYINVYEYEKCPAKGIILNEVFEKFIDKIFRETTTLNAVNRNRQSGDL